VEVADDEGQAQTQKAFAFKWTRDEWGYCPEHRKVIKEFLWERFGFETEADLVALFGDKRVLHAGIGSGQTEQHYLKHTREVWGADISLSVENCAKLWEKYYPEERKKLHLVQADLMAMPFEDESFDVIFSDGVFHHTPSTRKALGTVAKKLKIGGRIAFYIYKKKPPIREFVDDFLREKIANLSPEEAWKALEPLTAMARDLSQQGATVEITEPVPMLGLEAGTFSLQRWLYWNCFKFYWREEWSFDENNHVNYDWYYPRYAWRHTPEEVRGWLEELHLEEEHFHIGDAGLSIIARRLR
jgi:SAM-dependent methyltransferase